MQKFAKCGVSPAERATIAAIMREAVAKIVREPDNHAANEVSRMLGALAAVAPLWEAELVERVVHSKVEGWSRGIGNPTLVASSRSHVDIARVAGWQPKEPIQKRLRM